MIIESELADAMASGEDTETKASEMETPGSETEIADMMGVTSSTDTELADETTEEHVTVCLPLTRL